MKNKNEARVIFLEIYISNERMF